MLCQNIIIESVGETMITKSDRIAIFGSGVFAISIIKHILLHGNQKISMIIPDCPLDEEISTIPVYSVYDAINNHRCEFDKLLVVEKAPYTTEKYQLLYELGISDIYILIAESKELFDCDNNISMAAIQHFNLQNKPLLRYFEMHLVDFCNLNCKGCTHFSNLCDENTPNAVANIDEVEKQLKQLSKLCDVSIIRLMGGEPLLYPKLDQLLPMVRGYFPQARIFLVTNALFISRLNSYTCELIRDNEIFINISLYQPTFDKASEIEEFLNLNKIVHFWRDSGKGYNDTEIVEEFHKCLSTTKKEGSQAYTHCYNKYCWFLRNGEISKCNYPLLIDLINCRYGSIFEVNKKDKINIFQCNSGWEIIRFLNNVIPFCKYCRDEVIKFKWESGRIHAELDDYVL